MLEKFPVFSNENCVNILIFFTPICLHFKVRSTTLTVLMRKGTSLVMRSIERIRYTFASELLFLAFFEF